MKHCSANSLLFIFQTDLKNTDYTLEAGAKRNFEAAKLAEEMEERSRKEKEEEELNNPMKVYFFFYVLCWTDNDCPLGILSFINIICKEIIHDYK